MIEQPRAPQRPKEISYHQGKFTLQDPYAWLRDPSWKQATDGVKDPEIIQYLESEKKYSEAFLSQVQADIDQYTKTRMDMIPDVDQSCPVKRRKYTYWSVQEKNWQYPIYLRKLNKGKDEVVYFDENLEADGGFYSLGCIVVSNCETLMGYAFDRTGDEFYEIRVRNLETGEELSDSIPMVDPYLVWNSQATGFYYLRLTQNSRPRFVCYHELGTDVSKDLILYEETDDLFYLNLQKTSDCQYLIIRSVSKNESALSYIDLTKSPRKPFQLIARKKHRHVKCDHRYGTFYCLLNDMGENFRLVKGDLGQIISENWEEIIPHSEKRYLTSVSTYANGTIITAREKGLSSINFLCEEIKQLNPIPMTDETYEVSLSSMPFESTAVRYHYSSLSRPGQVMECDFQTKKIKVRKKQPMPLSFKSSQYKTEGFFITARDGEKVPVSLVFRRDKFKKNGSNPLFLYGYGSYGYSAPRSFRSWLLPYLDAGFVFAIAHIRGGSEMGYSWYMNGKMDKKWNTFHDFIDTAEALIEKNYTKAGNITAMGGSAGGLLLGVCANEAPHLFKSMIFHVPFVDLMNTMLDDSLPLTKGEFIEWGNPAENAKVFKKLLSYSPYDNIQKKNYPAMFITGGLYDYRVTYWEPLKYIAKLRDNTTSGNPLFLRMTDAGHAGGSARDVKIKEDAESYAFVMAMHR